MERTIQGLNYADVTFCDLSKIDTKIAWLAVFQFLSFITPSFGYHTSGSLWFYIEDGSFDTLNVPVVEELKQQKVPRKQLVRAAYNFFCASD